MVWPDQKMSTCEDANIAIKAPSIGLFTEFVAFFWLLWAICRIKRTMSKFFPLLGARTGHLRAHTAHSGTFLVFNSLFPFHIPCLLFCVKGCTICLFCWLVKIADKLWEKAPIVHFLKNNHHPHGRPLETCPTLVKPLNLAPFPT